jgi:hypothetical protein
MVDATNDTGTSVHDDHSSGTSVWIATTLHISEISMTFEELPVSREYAK